MKLLILCVLVAAAAAIPAVAPVYEPNELDHSADHSCLMCGDPLIHTMDHHFKTIGTTDKITMFKTKKGVPAGKEHCKFEVDCVVKAIYYYDDIPNNGAVGPMFVDWCGVAFWETKNGDGLFRNWMIGQDPSHFGERGVGIKGWKCMSLPQTFPKKQEKMNQPPWKKLPKKYHPVNACTNGKPAYTIEANAAKKRIEIRSDCCPFAIDWYPAGRATCINIFMKKNEGYEGTIRGMCGNANGDPADDNIGCDDAVYSDDQAGWNAQADSCKLEDVQAAGFPGGTKLHTNCPDPGPAPLW